MQINNKTVDLSSWLKERQAMKRQQKADLQKQELEPEMDLEPITTPSDLERLYAKGSFSKAICGNAAMWNDLERICQTEGINSYSKMISKLIQDKAQSIPRNK